VVSARAVSASRPRRCVDRGDTDGRGRGAGLCVLAVAAHAWAVTEHQALQRISPTTVEATGLDQAVRRRHPPPKSVPGFAASAWPYATAAG
jgi:hypothetical protein